MAKPKKTPRRAEYERLNPVFSARVDRETYDLAKELCAKSGKTFADLLRELVGRQRAVVDDAYARGFGAARSRYRFAYACHRCGRPVLVLNPGSRRQIAEFLTQERWGHATCPPSEAGSRQS